ncbi:hypothetical protein UFOVP1454_49 [uncultured Caudovirales phage]|uniref:Uncharacterized protein n=1 Tax=uncultured Caudovirales phage TaxID=2100421 RepID=A0A6J5SKD1_9CAUD|nr:hypothetical protein UFOVP1454_49 [uncultured Caudovirales phage]
MTTPTIYATGEGVNSFLNAPSGVSDGVRLVTRSAVVADSASSGTIYGMIPFTKGAQICPGSLTLTTSAIDTATLITLDIGYVYESPDTTNSISDPNAFVDASTAGRAAAVVNYSAVAGATFVAGSNGWITVTTGGGSVTTAGTFDMSVMLSYQS